MKNLTLVLLAGMAAVSASGCGRRCKEARTYILQPTTAVSAYLQANPNGQNLAEAGCPYLLQQFVNLPQGAQTIREIADQRFTDTYSRCLYYVNSVRYVCDTVYTPHGPQSYCHPETYTYCGQWETESVHENGYDQAIALSHNLDLLYDKAHQMCGQAVAGNYDAAYAASRELLGYMVGTVKPDEDTVYSLACGSN